MSMMAANTVTPVAHSRSDVRALSWGVVVVMPAPSLPLSPPVAPLRRRRAVFSVHGVGRGGLTREG
ncbi:hypothetical protein GCM10010309_29250 [Streptomyces violaceochromogenes]|nr:hypothetical protein GCM10010309_29250 [Streptomyces violaceochromogenes]